MTKDRASTISISALLILGLMTGLPPFAIDMYLPSILQIAIDLGSSTQQVEMSISVFLLTFALGQLIYGPLSDSFGRKKILVMGLLVFIVASVGLAKVESLTALLLWRVGQAVGGSAIAVCVTATLRDSYKGNALARMMSFLFAITVIAPMIAPTIGGQILQLADWRWIFWLIALLAVISTLLYGRYMHESHPPARRRVLSVQTVFDNYRQVLMSASSWGFLLLIGFSSAPMFIFITSSPFVYIEYFGILPQHFGYYFAANVGVMMISSLINGWLLNRIAYPLIMKWALIIWVAVVSLLLLVSLIMTQYLLWVMVPLIVLTVGLLPFMASNAMAGLMSQHGEQAGSAASIAGACRFGVGALAGLLAVLGPGWLAIESHNHLPMVVAMAISAWLAGLAFVYLALLNKRSGEVFSQ